MHPINSIPGNCRWCLYGHTAPVNYLRLDPTGYLCLSTDSECRDRSIRIWDLNKGSKRSTFSPQLTNNPLHRRQLSGGLHAPKKRNSVRDHVKRSPRRARTRRLPGTRDAAAQRPRRGALGFDRELRVAGEQLQSIRTEGERRVLTGVVSNFSITTGIV